MGPQHPRWGAEVPRRNSAPFFFPRTGPKCCARIEPPAHTQKTYIMKIYPIHQMSYIYFSQWCYRSSHTSLNNDLNKIMYNHRHCCHELRYWSTMDQYKATLLQGKQAQDTFLWFPYRFRAGRTMGKSCGHCLVQVPECGNKPNQAWESCTTIRQSGD